MSEEPKKITAEDVRAALRAYYPAPRCAVAFEVAQGTGLKANRHLDAIAMDLWSSHGHAIHGIEIKVSRSDLRRELADPSKAEELARFCDYFWLAGPRSAIIHDEIPLPPAWGVLQFEGGKIRAARPAAKTKAEPIDRHFFAAMFRAATQSMTKGEAEAMLAKERTAMAENNRATIDREVDRRTQENLEDANKWRRLRAEIGEGRWGADEKDLIAAYKVLNAAGILGIYGGLNGIATQLDSSAKRIREALNDLALPATAAE